jgi:hypothetical protein
MNAISKITLVAAATLAFSTPSFAQLTLDLGGALDASGDSSGSVSTDNDSLTTSSTGDANATTGANANVDGDETNVAASGALSFDANGDGTLSVEELAAVTAALEAAGNADFAIDANGDGSLDAEEAVALSAALTGSVATDVSFDADGDGIISPDEEAAAIALLTSDDFNCSETGLESVIGLTTSLDIAKLANVTDAEVIVIADCDAADISAALASQGSMGARDGLKDNELVISAVRARGFDMDDVVGARISGDTITIYVVTDQATG